MQWLEHKNKLYFSRKITDFKCFSLCKKKAKYNICKQCLKQKIGNETVKFFFFRGITGNSVTIILPLCCFLNSTTLLMLLISQNSRPVIYIHLELQQVTNPPLFMSSSLVQSHWGNQKSSYYLCKLIVIGPYSDAVSLWKWLHAAWLITCC